MLNPDESVAPVELVSLRTIRTAGAEKFERHDHSFHEFTLVTDDSCSITYPGGVRATRPSTLFLYNPGEMHGALCKERECPRFWVAHFRIAEAFQAQLESLFGRNAQDRVFTLGIEQVETFQWIFLQLLNERSSRRVHRELALGSWLQLLLINVDRWTQQKAPSSLPIPSRVSPEAMRLWQSVNESVSLPSEQLTALYRSPNYDSARHAFRKAFGCSPREMLIRLRMEHAKNLLLESSLSIKEIAGRVGYSSQHDFNRMFRRYAGMPPSHWRADPFATGREGG